MSYSTASPPKQPEPSFSSRPSSVKSISELSTRRPSFTTTAKAIGLYFEYCHRQPIWCFDRGEVEDQDRLPDELVWSIMALTSRFSQDRDQSQHYDGNAKSLIMLRIANGTVDVSTIESLCLLSYAYFIGMLGFKDLRVGHRTNNAQTEIGNSVGSTLVLLFSSVDLLCWTSSLYTYPKIQSQSGRSDFSGACNYLSNPMVDRPVFEASQPRSGVRLSQMINMKDHKGNPTRNRLHCPEIYFGGQTQLTLEFGA